MSLPCDNAHRSLWFGVPIQGRLGFARIGGRTAWCGGALLERWTAVGDRDGRLFIGSRYLEAAHSLASVSCPFSIGCTRARTQCRQAEYVRLAALHKPRT